MTTHNGCRHIYTSLNFGTVDDLKATGAATHARIEKKEGTKVHV
jgi:hypothetical protein